MPGDRLTAAEKRQSMHQRAAARMTEWLGADAGRAMHRYMLTARRSDGGRVYANVNRRICELDAPRYLSPPPTTGSFDVQRVNHFLNFCRRLRHMKGSRWAGKRLELDMWQVIFCAAPVFGWLDSDGKRIRRTLYLEVPKKNGKSTLAAALALYLLVEDGESGAEVIAVAGNIEQAKAVFDVAFNMARLSPYLAERLRFLKGNIVYERALSWFKVQSSDGELKAGLNLHGAVLDELLVQKNRALVDNLEGATASRTQPLIAYLTTAGLDDNGTVYHEKHRYSERIATGELSDDSWHGVIYTPAPGADWRLPETWRQANPGLGISVDEAYLTRRCAQAQASPAAKNAFLRDHLNVRTGSASRWLDAAKWDSSGSRYLTPLEHELRGEIAFCGLDLASSVDLAALAIVVPRWEINPLDADEMVETLCVFVRAWTPADTLEDRAMRDGAPYLEWVEAGLLSATPGDVIDYDEIEAEVFAVAERYDVRRFQFDRWGSKQLIQHVADEIGHHVVFGMGQGFASMSPAMRETERLILHGRIRHGGSPLLRSALGNLAVVTDSSGNIKPDRAKSSGRIDPFVAMVMGIDAWSRGDSGVSAYEADSA